MASKNFNTISCIATPIHPTSRLPMPSYERQKNLPEEAANAILDLGYRSESYQDDDEEEAEDGEITEEDAGTNHLRSLQSAASQFIAKTRKNSTMTDSETCAPFDATFYEKLKLMKQQNIYYLQEVEAKLNGKPMGRRPLKKPPKFILNAPCSCSNKGKEMDLDETEDSEESIIEEEIHGIFDGVSEESEVDDLDVNITKTSSRAKSKLSIRVQSAPVYIDESKQTSTKPFKPTVTRPFSMTKRDEEKARERALMKKILEERQKSQNENDDISKKVHFKATPVPHHVKEQLFEKMVNEQPSRYKIGLMKNVMKRAKSEPTNVSSDGSEHFKAKPFPEAIFKDYAHEQMLENQRYRDVRKALRQKALLSTAKLPPRMQKLQEQSSSEKRDAKRKDDSSFAAKGKFMTKPPIVPDFEKSYQNFLRSMQRKKAARPTTVIQPFSFDDEIDYYKKSKPKPENSSLKAGANLTRKFTSTPNLSSSVTEAVLATTANTASHLRTRFNRHKMEIYDKEELLRRRKQLENEMRQVEMRENHPAWQKLRYEVVDHNEMEVKKSQRVLEDRERAREYKLELEKMMVRVQNQPTLFERQSVMSAKQQAEKRYKQLLQKEGVTEDEISKLITDIDCDYETSRKSSMITDH